MANFEPKTTSNQAKLSDPEAVRRIVASYESDNLAMEIRDGRLRVYGDDWFDLYTPDDVDTCRSEEFLKRIQPYLETPLVVQCVGAAGCRFPFSMWQCVVTRDAIRHWDPNDEAEGYLRGLGFSEERLQELLG